MTEQYLPRTHCLRSWPGRCELDNGAHICERDMQHGGPCTCWCRATIEVQVERDFYTLSHGATVGDIRRLDPSYEGQDLWFILPGEPIDRLLEDDDQPLHTFVEKEGGRMRVYLTPKNITAG